jgi:hypothetical protein
MRKLIFAALTGAALLLAVPATSSASWLSEALHDLMDRDDEYYPPPVYYGPDHYPAPGYGTYPVPVPAPYPVPVPNYSPDGPGVPGPYWRHEWHEHHETPWHEFHEHLRHRH